MKDKNKIKLFLVDDDAVFLKLLEIEFVEHSSFSVETFMTGEQCIENLAHKPDVIILDYHLDGNDKSAMNGLIIMDRIKAINPGMPVIILSCQDKIEVAVNCMHHGALDYVVKSETAFLRLKMIIETLFQQKKMEKELNWYMDRM